MTIHLSRSCSRLRPTSFLRTFLICSLSACAWAPMRSLQAEDLVNAAVPSNMNGGSSTYLLDDYAINWGAIAVSVGNTTSYNSIIVRNGATATSAGASNRTVALGRTATSSFNEATVTGSGTIWSVTGASFQVGVLGSNNRLTISLGATVSSTGGSIGSGRNDNAAYGSNNEVLVTGAGSNWSMTGTLSAGGQGSNNKLTVSDGATITSDSGNVGGGSSDFAYLGNNNTVLVTGVGTTWSTNGATGRTSIGVQGSSNSFTLAARATAISKQVSIGSGHSLHADVGLNNVATVQGAGTTWTVSYSMVVGAAGASNALVIKEGAKVTLTGETEGSYATIGQGASETTLFGNQVLGNENSVTVTGAGSEWNIAAPLVVGEYGSRNRLLIQDGGRVTTSEATIGLQSVGTGAAGDMARGRDNEIVVSGVNATFMASVSLSIGSAGNTGNTLSLTNHGLAVVGDDESDLFRITTGNFLRLDGGYLALFGDQVSALESLVAAGSVQIGQGGGWSSAAWDDLNVAYFAPGADTSMATGGSYGDLGGYTVISSAVPEPDGKTLLTLSAGVMCLIRWRRMSTVRG